MGKSKAKSKVSSHSSSTRRGSDASSSSGKATSSAPRSTHSGHSISRLDGPTSPPSTQPKSPRSPSQKSPPRSPEGESSSRSTAIVAPTTVPKNIDLGALQYSVVRGIDPIPDFPLRPKQTSKLGVDAKIKLNTFNVTSYPTREVYQYEVLIGNGVEKRGVVKAVWASEPIRRALGSQVIFDGDHLAWGLKPIVKEIRELVDLDKERGRTARPGKEDRHRVVIRQTTKVKFNSLQAFLNGRASFDKSCLEAINCLDHILREHPATRLLALKRAFYPKTGERFDLGSGLEAVKGAYQSLRAVLGPQGPVLSVNVDVSNGTFFQGRPLLQLIILITGCRDVNDLSRSFAQSGGANGRLARDIGRLKKRRVVASHRKGNNDEYVIDRFEFAGAKAVKFNKKDANGREVQTSVYDFFRSEYKLTLQHPDLPLVKTPKGAYLPMEVLRFKSDQVCRYKLDDRQTSNMIKFAVTPPGERWNAVQQGLRTLDWAADPVINTFGLKITTAPTVVPARVLPAPKVVFAGNGSAAPGTSGRWDLKGKKFLTSNTAPLKVWGVMVIMGGRGGKPEKSTVENFTKAFVNGYIAHGGRVETKQPPMLLSAGNDPAAWVTTAWNTVGKQFNARPQMIMFILPDKNTESYNRIKRSMDCRFGAVSQCVQYSHVQKCQAQYISNVCMKFNAKLGGTTCRAVGARSAGATGLFTCPTVIIGADVSHAAPGSAAASAAAMTVSMDRLGIQYAAAVESNGYRVEMITESNIKKHLTPLLQIWCTNVNNGKAPSRCIYIRDGVSEGQFRQVLDQEVRYMKEIMKSLSASVKVDFVVIIAQKRHQIRFFPEKGDRNGNALPGTLVEGGATHPFENDFYLCAHAAIKGTARPVHYQVILNEASMSNDEIYTLLYEHSYQYLRATTPVSIHPAVYYAHIASNRGVCHDPKYGSLPDNSDNDSRDNNPSAVSEPLLAMPNDGGIREVPWYI